MDYFLFVSFVETNKIVERTLEAGSHAHFPSDAFIAKEALEDVILIETSTLTLMTESELNLYLTTIKFR